MLWRQIQVDNKLIFRFFIRLTFLIGVFLLTPNLWVTAQESLTCPALVEQALFQIDNNCEGLERNVGCYAHNQVFSTFTVDQPSDTFSRPSDRIALSALRSIQTSALDLAGQRWGAALLNIQANLPNTLPGQGVILLLLGDVALENTVTPEQVLVLGDGVPVTTRASANLRSGPGLTSNVIATINAGVSLLADGIEPDRNWLRVVYEDTPAWVGMGAVESGNHIDGLPVLAPDRRTPMQAFHLRTGFGVVGCDEAPSVLAIKSPEQLTVTLSLNGAEMQVGSLVTLQSLADSQMRLTVHQGMVELTDGTLAHSDETLIAELNPEGDIVGWSPPRPATPAEQAIGAQVETILDNLNRPNANVPPPANWSIGQLLEVVNPNGAWLRQTPDSSSTVIVTVLPDRTPVVVLAAPQWDGVQWWWQVRTDDGRSSGWLEQSQLRERLAQPPSACASRTDWAYTYTVQPGDTLFQIAQRAGVSLTDLQIGNCIADPGAIAVGQVLRVPQPVQTAPPPAPPAGTSDDSPRQPQPPPPAATEEVQDGGQLSNPPPLLVITPPTYELIVPIIPVFPILPTPTPVIIR
jgi:uncharacterized protein YgiM (DUF1202 family)